jgi:hypothetical protein
MVYAATAQRSLNHRSRDAAGWTRQTVDRLADAGSFNSLAVSTAALDAAGGLLIRFYDFVKFI